MREIKQAVRLLGLMVLIFAGCAPRAALEVSPQPSEIPPSATVPIPTMTLTARPTITVTPSPTPLPVVRFAVIGDYGLAGDDLAAVAALVDSWEVDLIITTGDNNYPFGAASDDR